MIRIMCNTSDTLKLSALKAFQGDLKHRSKSDLQALATSIQSDGLIMPFAVWKTETDNALLDGHGRLAALLEMAAFDTGILEQDFPVIYINASSEEEARKLLLQISSSYGKVTKEGALNFCKSIPEYHAPVINKYVHKKPVTRVLQQQPLEAIVRIKVPVDKEQEVRKLLAEVSYIKVL